MAQLERLFEPGKIGKLEIKNRIYMAPMVSGTAKDGYSTQRMIDYFVARARGGVGMISCQSSCILYESRAPGRLFVYDDKFIPKLRELTDAVHKAGARIALEVAHWGMLSVNHIPAVPNPEAIKVVAPSQVLYVSANYVPQAATQDDIVRIVAGFGEGARRIKDAGFDAVEIHGAHGRLIGQFLSPLWNQREDKYGGSVQNRARFACEVISDIRKKVGPDFPVIFRLSGSDFLEGSITLEHSLVHAPMFVDAGADALHVSASTPGSYHWQFPCYLFPDGPLVPLAEALKKVVKVPIIAVAKLGDPAVGEEVLRQGKADFIAMGRPLMADPDLPNKAKEGRFDDIRRCIFCNNCLKGGDKAGRWAKGHNQCTVNPSLCRETEFELKPAAVRKNVMVVGGGLAGMEAGRVMAERGHRVTLYEKGGKLGGAWNIASVAVRETSGNFARFGRQLAEGVRQAGVNVVLNTAVTAQLVKKARPDVLVVATGAGPITPDVPGVNGSHVVQANDVFLGKAKVGQRVVVIGAGMNGMEVAKILVEQGKRVTLVDQVEIGRGVEKNIFLTLRDDLVEKGVQFFPHSPLLAVLDNGVHINFQSERFFLKADTVVLAVGVKPARLAQELEGLAPEVYAIGDCVEPRDAREATREGAEIGRKV